MMFASSAGAVVSILNWGGAIALDGPLSLRIDLGAAGCFPDGVNSLRDVLDASTGKTLTTTSAPCGGGEHCVTVELKAAHANFVVFRVL